MFAFLAECPYGFWRYNWGPSRSLGLQPQHRGSGCPQGPVHFHSTLRKTKHQLFWENLLHTLVDNRLRHNTVWTPAITIAVLRLEIVWLLEGGAAFFPDLWSREHDKDISPSFGKFSHFGLKSLKAFNLHNVHHSEVCKEVDKKSQSVSGALLI